MHGDYMGRVKRIWYLSPMRAAKVQASLRIRAVSPEPPLLDHTSSESRGTFRQKARSLAPLNGWACAVKICHDGMLEDTNSLDGAQLLKYILHSNNITLRSTWRHKISHYLSQKTLFSYLGNCPLSKGRFYYSFSVEAHGRTINIYSSLVLLIFLNMYAPGKGIYCAHWTP